MGTEESEQRDRVFLNLFRDTPPEEVTDEEVAYFRKHPDEIDEITAPVNVHKLFLWAGGALGVALVGLAKLLDFDLLPADLSEGLREFFVDIVFEAGVALIGAAVTAYILGILLDRQQEHAAIWRAEMRRRLQAFD